MNTLINTPVRTTGIRAGMPPHAAASEDRLARLAGPALKAAAAFWYGVVALGQLAFVVYIAGFYGRAAWQGEPERWNTVLPQGYVPGDTLGNLVLGVHLVFAFVITVGGVLQLLPPLRRVAPAFHRWNGRVYLIAAVLMSIGGLVMVWTHGAVDDVWRHLSTSLNAVLILVFAGFAVHHARARRLSLHRRWALRLFLAVSGVWFFRVGLMFWIVANQGPVGFDPKTFTGPFLTFLAFAQYLLPLALLELYFRAEASTATYRRLAMAAALAVVTLAIAVGIVAAARILWLPHL
ncbi:putative membrane protein DUF2306 [Tahibacter aquaticus]|uniref:Putative membrane protein DUF2306 n=1 Tax=Tahibacter aquaticus TaxID=520092 RepID=A0A4R6Z4I8_9GAMM|nr:DUF2306 domain-containing protein [Tahibacter aquaticus]TDR46597.1 putative membrane protein DUF2306 [Tahibacter aquaticus]